MPRKTALLLLAASLVLAGCVGTGPAAPASPTTDPGPTDSTPTDTASATPSPPPTPSLTPTPGDGTPANSTDYRTPHYGPDSDHEVVVENRLDGDATLHVTVVREATNGTVHDRTVTVAPGERTVYNTKRAAPDGIESFRIVAERGDDRAAVTIETSECYGNVIVWPTDDGGVDATYAVC